MVALLNPVDVVDARQRFQLISLLRHECKEAIRVWVYLTLSISYLLGKPIAIERHDVESPGRNSSYCWARHVHSTWNLVVVVVFEERNDLRLLFDCV